MQKRRERLLVILGIVIFVALFGVTYSKVTAKEANPPAQKANAQEGAAGCTGCHEMLPEITTWQISSHSKIACTECHTVNPDDYKAKHEGNGFSKPIKMPDGITNDVCMKCHTENRVSTPSGDLIIPHDRHNTAGVACVKCHSGVVHAKIADRGLTAKGDLANYQSWNPDVAKKVAAKYYLQPNMWTCINCHRQAGVTRSCNACHTAIQSLPSHEQPTWRAQHGKLARTNVGDCTKCHVTPGLPKFVTPSTGDLAADFARAQDFCSSCHLMRPKMHESSMMPIHPQKAAERGIQNCLTCHDREEPKSGAKVTGTYCNQCHWFQ